MLVKQRRRLRRNWIMLRRVIAKKNHILFYIIIVYYVIIYLLIVIVTMTYVVMRQVVIMNPFNNISNEFCLRCIIILNYSPFCDGTPYTAVYLVLFINCQSFRLWKHSRKELLTSLAKLYCIQYNMSCILIYYHTLLYYNVQYKRCRFDAELNARCVAYFDLKII